MQTAGVKLIGIDGADHAFRFGEWPAAQALLDSIGSETQIVVASGSFEGDLADLLERRLARPKRWPEELFAAEPSPGGSEGRLWCGAAAREEERIDLLAASLADASREAGAAACAVLCATEPESDLVRAGLKARGLNAVERAGQEGEPSAGILVTKEQDRLVGEFAAVARWGQPDDLEAYEALPAAARRIAIVDSIHLQQLQLLARRGKWAVEPLGGGLPVELDAVERFRETVRNRVAAADLSGELLLLQPLLEEHAATNVAGALAALLREGGSEPPREDEPGKPDARRPAARAAVLPAWTKLFVSVGKRDGAGPGDIVGAITGETGAAGGQIGLIEVRASFTLVDVDAEIADRVIEGLSGTQIKGRTVSARRAKESA